MEFLFQFFHPYFMDVRSCYKQLLLDLALPLWVRQIMSRRAYGQMGSMNELSTRQYESVTHERSDKGRARDGNRFPPVFPSCRNRPSCNTATRSPTSYASSRSWVTNKTVVPSSLNTFHTHCLNSFLSCRSRLLKGSSKSNSFGFRMRERIRETRCCWPPDKLRGIMMHDFT